MDNIFVLKIRTQFQSFNLQRNGVLVEPLYFVDGVEKNTSSLGLQNGLRYSSPLLDPYNFYYDMRSNWLLKVFNTIHACKLDTFTVAVKFKYFHRHILHEFQSLWWVWAIIFCNSRKRSWNTITVHAKLAGRYSQFYI